MQNKLKVNTYNFWYSDYLLKDFINLGYTEDDLKAIAEDLTAYLANTPPKIKGDVIPKTSGAVKLRMAPKSSTKGARDEDRLIYYCHDKSDFYFIYVYAKSEKIDLNSAEIKALVKFIKQVKNS
ncbi:hypothetical protein [Vagococcus salmoninarum]|uniref:hypothetical protein n=1 Tax=Vagococcus salmoninarum TaxID=2739 RepID=UPI003F976D7D